MSNTALDRARKNTALNRDDLRLDCARLAVKALSSRFDLMTAEEIAQGSQDLTVEIMDAIDWWLTWRYGS